MNKFQIIRAFQKRPKDSEMNVNHWDEDRQRIGAGMRRHRPFEEASVGRIQERQQHQQHPPTFAIPHAAASLDHGARDGYVQQNPQVHNPPVGNSAFSPMACRPAISMIKSKRKRAFVAASYYSECFQHGIRPTEADLAANEADKRYKKWWVDTAAHNRKSVELGDDDSSLPAKKKTKLSSPARGVETEKRKAFVSDDSGDDSGRKSFDEASSRYTTTTTQQTLPTPARQVSLPGRSSPAQLSEAKAGVIHALHASGGDTSELQFQSYLKVLEAYYSSSGFDERWTPGHQAKLEMDGTWLTLSKPTYSECHGKNDRGDNTYTLGRMSFDMFRPTGLVCSIQATLHSIRPVSQGKPVRYPSSIRKDIRSRADKPEPRTYDIVVALTVEAGQTRRGEQVDKDGNKNDEFVVPRPVPCLLTNHGYCLPDPTDKNRLSIWFVGGSLEVQDETTHLQDWRRLFDRSEAPNRDIAGFARVLAARMLLGAECEDDSIEDGAMKYTFKRPIGGHGQVFCDVVYADDSLRILRGHSGSLFVNTKIPEFS